MPARLTCMTLASVPVARPLADIWYGTAPLLGHLHQAIDYARVHVRAPINHRPAAEAHVPFLLLSTVGQSVACVTSTAMPICGLIL